MIIKMDKTAIIVSVVVVSVGLLGAILAFIAEGFNPSGTSVALGIGAAILLLGGQITVSVVGGCFGCCCNKSRAVPSKNNRIVGIVCGVFSWISAAVALVLFLAVGSLAVGTYAAGGVLTLLATALGVTSFIVVRGPPVPDGGAPNGGTTGTGEQQVPAVIAMGHPQFPPSAPPKPSEQPPPTGEIVAVGHPDPSQFPSKPQVAPTGSDAQGYGSYAPNQQFPPSGEHGS